MLTDTAMELWDFPASPDHNAKLDAASTGDSEAAQALRELEEFCKCMSVLLFGFVSMFVSGSARCGLQIYDCLIVCLYEHVTA